MNTLELMIKSELDNEGVMYNGTQIKSIANYIEDYNSKLSPLDAPMTPSVWLNETKRNYPDSLVYQNGLYFDVCGELLAQYVNCIEETGCLPTINDIIDGMNSDTMRERMRGYDITVESLLMYLVKYYMKRRSEVEF